MADYKNRIVGHEEVAPDQLLANPHNWRIHKQSQQKALTGSLDTLGWVTEVIVNRQTQRIIDGHLRVSLALRTNQKTVPVTYVELTEAEEAQALLSLDAIAALAETDREQVDALLRQVETDNADVMQFLTDFAAKEGAIPPDFQPVGIDEQGRLDQKKPVICPECGAEFVPKG